MGFLVDLMVKNLFANAGDMGSIPGSGRSPGEGNGSPLQHSCLGNLMDRGAGLATVCGVTKRSNTAKGLNNNRYGDTYMPYKLKLIEVLHAFYECKVVRGLPWWFRW